MDFSATLTCTNTFQTYLMDLVSGAILQSFTFKQFLKGWNFPPFAVSVCSSEYKKIIMTLRSTIKKYIFLDISIVLSIYVDWENDGSNKDISKIMGTIRALIWCQLVLNMLLKHSLCINNIFRRLKGHFIPETFLLSVTHYCQTNVL